MNKQEFLFLLDELFEVDSGTLTGTELLADLGIWDSMTALGYIALLDEKFNLVISGEALSQSTTVNDLVALAGTNVTS